MDRPLYAVCPRCGRRAKITKFFWDWEEDETIALIKCTCGKSQMYYAESRVLQIDLVNPYMHEEHFNLLVPPGWNRDMWNKVSAGLSGW